MFTPSICISPHSLTEFPQKTRFFTDNLSFLVAHTWPLTIQAPFSLAPFFKHFDSQNTLLIRIQTTNPHDSMGPDPRGQAAREAFPMFDPRYDQILIGSTLTLSELLDSGKLFTIETWILMFTN